MDRIEGELIDLRARCAKYLDDIETVRGRDEFARLMHERVTRLEDALAKLFEYLGSDLIVKTLGLRL